ncbi:MAG: response regulator [Candidatus Eisenbacteria bacterium]|uniref:Response regulator n=1 Tax=Eiseniibacteriota bacterium TaxID=2212470 RepID=A0A849SUK1_UNCEI|nr:response regulator [Candidatus Eisenbacteria bacterium]
MADRILVVEDDERQLRVLQRFLEHEGYEFLAATDGTQALERVAEARPDLVLLDVRLPGALDGFAVCRRLKENEATALIPVTFLTSVEEVETRRQGLEAGADDFMQKPFDAGLLRARLKAQLRIKRLTDQLERTETVIFSMARWVEVKDPYTEGHLRRIAGYGESIASALGLSAAERRIVRFAGILHDIGKIGVRESILGKPGPLTPDEMTELQRHAEYGASIIRPMRFAPEVGPIILAHHEHWDGRGYPQGLSGEAIPIGARIIAVVDAWDAMTTDRPYRRQLDRAEAIRRLRAGAGTQWDPRVVEMLLVELAAGRLNPADLPESDLTGVEELGAERVGFVESGEREDEPGGRHAA